MNLLGRAVTGLPGFTAPKPSGVRLTASYQKQDGLLPFTWCHTLMPPANLQLQLPTGLAELMEMAMAYDHGFPSFGPTKTIKSLVLIVGNQIKRPINSTIILFEGKLWSDVHQCQMSHDVLLEGVYVKLKNKVLYAIIWTGQNIFS